MNKSVNKFAFSKLLNSARNQSKCKGIIKGLNVDKMNIQKYLICDKLQVEEQQLLYVLRSKSFKVKLNFSHMFVNNLKCRACNNDQYEESLEHFARICTAFSEERNGKVLNVEDIFGTLEEQIAFIKTFKHIARKWKLILEIT